MILRHSVTWLTPTISHGSEGEAIKTWAVLKTTAADVQPATLSENEVKLFGISSQHSDSKRIYFEADASIVEGLRAYTGGKLYDVRGGNPWSIHGVVLGTPVIGETYSAPAPSITYFGPLSGAIGSTVTIHGTSFVNVTGVKINGVAVAVYTVIDSSTITATIPAGATTGKISVSAISDGGLTVEDFSVEDFTVTP